MYNKSVCVSASLLLLTLSLSPSALYPQETGKIDTLTYFANHNIDIGGIGVIGIVDSIGVYFSVDTTWSEYKILEFQLLLSPFIYGDGDSSFTGQLDVHRNRASKRPGAILNSIQFTAEGAKDTYPNWLRIDLRDSAAVQSLTGDFWIVGFDLLALVASETRSGHTFLHAFTVWDSIEYDFAVKAIVQQNKPTSVPDELPQNRADQTAIQNYPNPFNQETVISLRLNEPQAVSISIYDISGRRVRNLVQNQILHPNELVVWDGKNSRDEPVSTGIYIYTVRFGQTSIQAKRMLLIR